MAWMTVNKQTQHVVQTTVEMNKLLGYDATGDVLSNIWIKKESDQGYDMVKTIDNHRTLCVCKHSADDDSDNEVWICSDITDISHIYSRHQQQRSVGMTRLTMYGSIDAAFLSPDFSVCANEWIGQPMMRYIHSDDVQRFCGALRKASEPSIMCTLQLRLLLDEEKIQWTEFTVAKIEGGRQLLCLIRPIKEHIKTPAPIRSTASPSDSITHLQRHVWRALECGMTMVATNVANTLMTLVQSLVNTWYLCHASNSWSQMLHSSSEYIIRKLVQSTKDRPEVDKMCYYLSYTGIPESISRSFVDNTLDQTTDWLFTSKKSNEQIV